MLDALVNDGVNGLIVMGTCGENNSLDPEEKRTILKAAVEVVNGRVPVVTGVSEFDTRRASAYARDAEKIGAGFVKLSDHRLIGRGGTERGEDLYFAVALHQFWLSWVPDVSDSWTIQLPCLPVSYSLNPIC